MPPQQHLYNGLARPADCSIFLLASPCWHRNGLARTESVLAYGRTDKVRVTAFKYSLHKFIKTLRHTKRTMDLSGDVRLLCMFYLKFTIFANYEHLSLEALDELLNMFTLCFNQHSS